MRLTKFKKTVFSVGLGVSLVSGAMVALAETPQVITRVSADAQHSQVIEDGNTTYIIQVPGQRAPSPIVTPGITTNIIRSTASNATSSNATSSNATSSNASRSRSSSGGSGSGSSRGGGSARPVTTATGNPAPSQGSSPSPTKSATPVDPSRGSNVGDVNAAKRGKLNVPKTADPSAMGLYTALLGFSAAAGALVVSTKKKED
nr:sortase B protein-sorting domain-containing protein [uncultured Lachnoanaerobaculum sp.]